MEALLNEMKNSLVSIKPTCKLIPKELPTVEIDVNKITESLEETKDRRSLVKKINTFHEFEKEINENQKEFRRLADKIRYLKDTISTNRKKEEYEIKHESENVIRVNMKVVSQDVSFQVKCDAENLRFSGLSSDPHIEEVRQIENLRDLEEIIQMMTASFKKHLCH